jgi:hypothetical protein
VPHLECAKLRGIQPANSSRASGLCAALNALEAQHGTGPAPAISGVFRKLRHRASDDAPEQQCVPIVAGHRKVAAEHVLSGTSADAGSTILSDYEELRDGVIERPVQSRPLVQQRDPAVRPSAQISSGT